ncbi:site-specific DNA-methyltransferase [Helicobacter cappadocius]|uniref:site-specific DNA-methyltransferase n=1 Tax=Helicobacter cappadocius TaxID=3063998 RepID=UPI00351DD78F
MPPPPLGFPNLLLKGNNLQALYTLKSIPSIYGNVKLIYIDPPYNTGNDSFNYNDNFNHSSWLTFMKNRLEIAREFLRDDGVIFIQCDDNEQAYLKVLCDEIFGRENFVNSVAVKTSETSGVKMAHIETKLPKIKEFLLLYKKNNLQIKPIKISKIDNDSFNKYSKYYSNIIENFNDEVKNWKITPLNEYLINNNLNLDEKQVVDFKIKNAHRMIYRTNNKSFEKYQIETNLAEITSSTGLKYVWWEGKQMLFLSDYLTETLGDLWIDISTINLNKEGECDFTNAKKPEALIQRIIEISTQKGDLVMDFFAGSGTTLAVAHKMGRRWVGIEQMDYIESITKERLCKVVLGEQGGVSKAVSWNPMQKNLLEEDSLPNSFVYAELMPLNETYKKLILEATEANISEVIEKMRENAFLDYRVDFVKIAKDSDFNALSLEDKKRILFSCLDSNLSYIPFSEIEDSDFKIPESLLQANKAFYRINKGIK